ncbi:MAG: ABC transporter permease [Spirochaetaceae bacterium]|nr:ABC transporter permease [Spirochaetaceae bacterium]
MRWIIFISRRFAKVDRSGRSAVTGFLASLSICFGVMTLIVTVSVMNGFQMGFIDSIMEISSAHVRITLGEEYGQQELEDFCFQPSLGVVSVEPMYEAQSLLATPSGRQSASLIRAVSPDILYRDPGLAKELRMISGSFDLSRPGYIILGSELARQLGVRVGSTVNMLALSGGSDVDLISDNRIFVVSGIFSCGYAEINSSFSFISLEAGQQFFGRDAVRLLSLKLKNPEADVQVIHQLENSFPGLQTESWRSYNRSFFGALKIEKNLLMMLVFLIFVVVGVNIFNGMRRMVFERRSEIAVLSALGGRKREVQLIFIIRGLLTGLGGAIPGLLLGMMLCVRMELVFAIIAKVSYWFQYLVTMATNPAMAIYVRENPMYQVYASIPARMMPAEIVFITIFGVFSALAASWVASRKVLSMTLSEVLHYE